MKRHHTEKEQAVFYQRSASDLELLNYKYAQAVLCPVLSVVLLGRCDVVKYRILLEEVLWK